MGNRYYLDMYTMAVGLEYYGDKEHYLMAGDTVMIDASNRVLKDGNIAGSIGKQTKYYEAGYKILHSLLQSGIYTLCSDDFIFLESADFASTVQKNDDNLIPGEVVYADDKQAIIFLGIASDQVIFKEEPVNQMALTSNFIDLDDELSDYIGEFGTTSLEEELLQLLENEPSACNDNEKGVLSKRKEENKMENVFGKLGFGKCTDERFSLSMNGIAVRQNKSNKYVVYNKDNNEFVDATDMLINIKNGLFVLPAMEVNVGDTVIHESKPYYIVNISNNEIKAVSYDECTQTVLIPKTTMFGLKYFNKVFSLFGDNFAATGEMFKNPMMLMALMDENKDSDFSNLLLMSSMSNNDFASNPMLMAMLMKKDNKTDMSDLLMLSMLNGKNNPFVSKAKKNNEEKK